MNPVRALAVAALTELDEVFAELGLPDVGDGWRITREGAVLIQLRPLTLAEAGRLVDALAVDPAGPLDRDGDR